MHRDKLWPIFYIILDIKKFKEQTKHKPLSMYTVSQNQVLQKNNN
jgi:hypothetical protein